MPLAFTQEDFLVWLLKMITLVIIVFGSNNICFSFPKKEYVIHSVFSDTKNKISQGLSLELRHETGFVFYPLAI